MKKLKKVEIDVASEILAKEIIKFAIKELDLEANYNTVSDINTQEDYYIVAIENATEKDLDKIQRNMKLKGVSIRTNEAASKVTEKIQDGFNYATQGVAMPIMKAGTKITTGIAGALVKTCVGSTVGTVNTVLESGKQVQQDLKNDNEIQELGKSYTQAKEYINARGQNKRSEIRIVEE